MQKRNRKIQSGRKERLITTNDVPFSYKEAFKALRTNVKFLAKANNAKSFVVTSALPEESKSNVAINLALSLAEEGNRVLLIDGDFRKPMLQNYLKLNDARKGVTNVLMDECKMTSVIHRLDKYNVDVLPTGTIPPNPSELLASERLRVFVQALVKVYDFVIFDAPPISVVTDAAVIGGMVDGALLVVRSDFAPVEAVKLAKQRLEDVNVKIYGTVLTRYKSNAGKGSGYAYSYENYYGYK